MIIYFTSITTKNSAIGSGVKLALIFLFSYIPRLVISNHLSIQMVKISFILLSWTVFVIGIFIFRKISSEKIIIN